MRASRHAQRAIKAVREAWLEDAVGKCGSFGQQGGGCITLLIPNAHRILQSPSASTSRQLSTSSAVFSYDGFARVLRQPVPKSLVFNRKNLKVWLRSKWDLDIAGQLLQLQLQRGNPSDADANKRAQQLLAQASSLSDISDFVEHLGPHVSPGLLSSAAAQAANLLQASLMASTTSTQPALDVKDAWPALSSVLHHLSPHLDKLAASEMSALLYGLSRTQYPLPSQTKTLLYQELAACVASKPMDARTLSSLMLSTATLGIPGFKDTPAPPLGEHIRPSSVWQQLSIAAAAQLNGMDAAQISQVVQALARSGDRGNRLWGPVLTQIRTRMLTWMQARPDQLAAVLHHVVSSGNAKAIHQLGPSAVKAWQAQQGTDSLKKLPARSLAHLAHFCAATSKRRDIQAKAQKLLDRVCAAARHQVTRLTPNDLQGLLTALSAAGKVEDPLVHLAADILRIRGFEGLGPVHSAALLASLADLRYPGADLCRSIQPGALASLPSLPVSALANLAWAYAHMANTADACSMVLAASAKLLDTSPGTSLPPAVLAQACVSCGTLQKALGHGSYNDEQAKAILTEHGERLSGVAVLLSKQLENVKGLHAKLDPVLAARLRDVMPELLAS